MLGRGFNIESLMLESVREGLQHRGWYCINGGDKHVINPVVLQPEPSMYISAFSSALRMDWHFVP